MFEVKHSPGGMVDAEFAVQYLVLSQSGAHPELRGNLGNIALLERAEQGACCLPGVGHAAANAYRELRRVQHRARLDEAPPRSSPRPASRARCRAGAVAGSVRGRALRLPHLKPNGCWRLMDKRQQLLFDSTHSAASGHSRKAGGKPGCPRRGLCHAPALPTHAAASCKRRGHRACPMRCNTTAAF